MVQIAHSQALSVFAEGLEHEADVTVVREAGVDALSGLLFSVSLGKRQCEYKGYVTISRRRCGFAIRGA